MLPRTWMCIFRKQYSSGNIATDATTSACPTYTIPSAASGSTTTTPAVVTAHATGIRTTPTVQRPEDTTGGAAVMSTRRVLGVNMAAVRRGPSILSAILEPLLSRQTR